MTKCKKCGGSGDLFRVRKGDSEAIAPFKETAVYKKDKISKKS